ncbi:hypothetical protein GCM10027275_37480 [Rhabdobacter roseus]|uniref:Uncharacterized protein YndB with AHSA1/START domain n=1 Tax=Rhabdobacter roseus TaxID=1655419 RepID=A0A840TX59_9BACT|nr:SRPBCC family protein [Rhabdobacter roseus]MBB5285843.1 uncharacterized protein YndB with AHSA1/START domain [Rhabdobacter roseus]
MQHEPLILERRYRAPIEKVWQALTDHEQMKQWYFDLPEFKPEVGFAFRFEGGKDGNKYLHLCEVTEVVVGQKLTYSWRYDGYAGNSFVTFELFDEGEYTRLVLTHAGLETFPLSNPDLARGNFEAGWNEIIGTSLKEFVETSTLRQSVEIAAVAPKVWEVLVASAYVSQWAQAFGEGTFVEASWSMGSEVLWKDAEGNIGAKGVVTQREEAVRLRVDYYDDVQSTPPAPTGTYSETYVLSEAQGQTRLSVEAGLLSLKVIKEHTPYWEQALASIKSLAEA